MLDIVIRTNHNGSYLGLQGSQNQVSRQILIIHTYVTAVTMGTVLVFESV